MLKFFLNRQFFYGKILVNIIMNCYGYTYPIQKSLFQAMFNVTSVRHARTYHCNINVSLLQGLSGDSSALRFVASLLVFDPRSTFVASLL